MRRLMICLVLFSLPAFADDNGHFKRQPRGIDRKTSEPDAVSQYITIDQRPFGWSPFQTDINWNPEKPSPIIPFGWGVIIIQPAPYEPDSGCRAEDNKKCATACNQKGMTLVACEIDIVWNEDGTTTRNRICTCNKAGVQDPKIAGSHIDTFEIWEVDE